MHELRNSYPFLFPFMIRELSVACQHKNEVCYYGSMRYYKNVELARLYKISEGTVRRWINATLKGKLDLQLHEQNGRMHVANTAKNTQIIKKIIAEGQKHANARWHKKITPPGKFYELYDKRQIVDIINGLEIYREMPFQYSYFGSGAKAWDTYAQRLWNEEDNDNTIKATAELLDSNFDNIHQLISEYECVNIIDIGVGNALPVRNFIQRLLASDVTIKRYIALDISPEILSIAKENITSWFPGQINFEGYSRNFIYDRFDDLLLNEDPTSTLNIVLFLGGTLSNLRDPNEALHSTLHSMSKNAVLLTSKKLDSDETRRYFDFHVESNLPELPLLHRMVIENLGIDTSLYSVIQGYDPHIKSRSIKIKLNFDITISFKIGDTTRNIDLNKDETILVWRAWHQNQLEAVNELNKNGFSFLCASVSNDERYILTISRRKDYH